MKPLQQIGGFIGVMLLVLVLAFINRETPTHNAVGSVAQGSDYLGTTTQLANLSSPAYPRTLVSGPGALGNVTITGPATGALYFYDASTTATSGSQVGRANSMSTTSLLIAQFPSSSGTSTYIFDTRVVNGLIVDVVGTVPTTTISYRQY